MSEAKATNKKAFRDYMFTDKWECGIELQGAEVKSIRAGGVNFQGSYARIKNEEMFLYGLHIEEYAQASYMNPEATRTRRLLLHKKEIRKIESKMNEKGLLLVPTKLYVNQRGFVKVEIALARSKKQYDKRATVKARDTDRRLKRILKKKL